MSLLRDCTHMQNSHHEGGMYMVRRQSMGREGYGRWKDVHPPWSSFKLAHTTLIAVASCMGWVDGLLVCLVFLAFATHKYPYLYKEASLYK